MYFIIPLKFDSQKTASKMHKVTNTHWLQEKQYLQAQACIYKMGLCHRIITVTHGTPVQHKPPN